MAAFTILNRQTRSNPVTISGGPVAAGNQQLTARLNCPSWATVTGSLEILLERSDDGATWRHWTDTVWMGGFFGRNGAMPAMILGQADLAGLWYRATLTPSTGINFGLDGELV